MKPFLTLVLILSVLALAGSEPASRIAGTPLTSGQLAANYGAGFTGGTICSMAGVALAVGVFGIVSAFSAGAALPLSFCFGASLAAHIVAGCALLE